MLWVERLQDVTGWKRPPHQGDWAATEAELGVSLPEDYKELCARFEPGTFSAYVTVLRDHGSDSLLANWRLIGRTAEQLDQVARTYEPYGLYSPAAGEGLILWGRSLTEAEYYWHVQASVSPDRWKVVARADSLGTWDEFGMSASEFLHHVIADPGFGTFAAKMDPPFYLPATQVITSGEDLAAWIRQLHPEQD